MRILKRLRVGDCVATVFEVDKNGKKKIVYEVCGTEDKKRRDAIVKYIETEGFMEGLK